MIVSDINPDMLAEGRKRALARGFGAHILPLQSQEVQAGTNDPGNVLRVVQESTSFCCRKRRGAQLAAGGRDGAALR